MSSAARGGDHGRRVMSSSEAEDEADAEAAELQGPTGLRCDISTGWSWIYRDVSANEDPLQCLSSRTVQQICS